MRFFFRFVLEPALLSSWNSSVRLSPRIILLLDYSYFIHKVLNAYHWEGNHYLSAGFEKLSYHGRWTYSCWVQRPIFPAHTWCFWNAIPLAKLFSFTIVSAVPFLTQKLSNFKVSYVCSLLCTFTLKLGFAFAHFLWLANKFESHILESPLFHASVKMRNLEI